MNKVLEKQILYDFYLENLDKANVFVNENPRKEAIFFNKEKTFIMVTYDNILVRSEDNTLLKELEKHFKSYPSEWFFEYKNIEEISKITSKYKQKILNFVPVFIPKDNLKKLKSPYKFKDLSTDDIEKFKDKSNFAFSFEKGYYEDKMGLAYYDKDRLIGLCGVSRNCKYFWEFGVEKLDKSLKYKNLGSFMLNHLTYRILEENKNILPITTTQFSHIKSINLSIKAGYKLGFTAISIG